MPLTPTDISQDERVNFVPVMVDKKIQDTLIDDLVPYFLRACESGELRKFYHMVLVIWFDIWPEQSQNKEVIVRNRFNVLMRITSKVIFEGLDLPSDEWIAAALDGVEVEKTELEVGEMFPRQKLDFQSMAVEVGFWDLLSMGARTILNSALPKTNVPEIAVENIPNNTDDDARDGSTRIDFITPYMDLPFEFNTGPSEDISLPWEKISRKAQERLKKCKGQEIKSNDVVGSHSNSDDVDPLFQGWLNWPSSQERLS
ncbi:hypothetical protein BYT27DRAFT_7262702 [Phlegmacium glaucopus]|nr:hypothetical protein BYT27DRAFT_7262702 [Phlegmacium glaucopus]